MFFITVRKLDEDEPAQEVYDQALTRAAAHRVFEYAVRLYAHEPTRLEIGLEDYNGKVIRRQETQPRNQ